MKLKNDDNNAPSGIGSIIIILVLILIALLFGFCDQV